MTLDERFRRSVPWRLPDLYLAVALATLGLVLVGVARVGVAGRDRLAQQVPWVNLGVGGLVVLCVGCVLWVLAGLRATAELRRVVLRQVRASLETTPSPTVAGAASEDGGFVSAPAMTRYHRPTCPLVGGKDVTVLNGDRADLRPCAVCLEHDGTEAERG